MNGSGTLPTNHTLAGPNADGALCKPMEPARCRHKEVTADECWC